MNRLAVLEKEINKGINFDEKSNEVINGWSPNNVRRLVIGANFVIVQYFVTDGNKYKTKTKQVLMQKELDQDLLMLGTKQVPSILKALVGSRICSSVEEIVFSTRWYNPMLLKSDYNINVLAPNSATSKSLEDAFKGRFVRLRYISFTDEPIESFGELIAKIDSKTTLTDVMLKMGMRVDIKVDINKDTWLKSTYLRPNRYLMDSDGSALSNYFKNLKETVDTEEHASKIEKAELDRNTAMLLKVVPACVNSLNMIDNGLKQLIIMYDKLDIYDKTEWGYLVGASTKPFTAGVSKYVVQHMDALKGVDFKTLEEYFKKVDTGVSEEAIDNALDFASSVYYALKIPKDLKTDTSLSAKLDAFKRFTALLVTLFYALTMATLIKRVSIYGEFGIEKMTRKLSSDYVNLVMTSGVRRNMGLFVDSEKLLTSDFLRISGVREVLEEQFDASSKMIAISKALKILTNGGSK